MTGLLQVCFPLPRSVRLNTTTQEGTDDRREYHYSRLDLVYNFLTGGLIPQQVCVARNPTKHKNTNIIFLIVLSLSKTAVLFILQNTVFKRLILTSSSCKTRETSLTCRDVTRPGVRPQMGLEIKSALVDKEQWQALVNTAMGLQAP